MKITYQITGPARKEFASAIGHLLEEDPVYKGPSSFAYDIGGYIVDKEGNLSTPDMASSDDIFRLVDALFAEYGYQAKEPMSELFPEAETVAEAPESHTDEETKEVEEQKNADGGDENKQQEESAESDDSEDDDDTHLTLSLPRAKFSPAAIERLQALVKSKQTLLKKVFQTDELPIVLTDDQIRFPWFTLQKVDGEVDAYAKFIYAIAMRALTSSRISAEEKPTDNYKFTMRLFLNHLGFKGEEFKFARRFLIRNLEGNGAWRYGDKPDPASFDLEMPTVVSHVKSVSTEDSQTEEQTEASEETVARNEEEDSPDEE